jgi:hypothetical protein
MFVHALPSCSPHTSLLVYTLAFPGHTHGISHSGYHYLLSHETFSLSWASGFLEFWLVAHSIPGRGRLVLYDHNVEIFKRFKCITTLYLGPTRLECFLNYHQDVMIELLVAFAKAQRDEGFYGGDEYGE